MTPICAAYDVLAQYPTKDYSQQLVVAKCRGLMAGYDARWQNQPYRIDGVEQFVQSDLWNPETTRKSRSFRLAGKLDITGWHGGRRVLIDHKTCSEDIADPNSPYWRQLIVEGQPTHYMLLEWLNGRKVDDAVWDVVRKPSISPKALAKADVQRALITKQYCGRVVSLDSLESLGREGRETLEMYEARLAMDCTTERPQWYFQRRSVPRLDADLHEWAVDLWGHSQDLLHARRENRWPKNAGACMNYGRPCRFLGICSNHDSSESDNWRPKAFVHAELPADDSDGRDFLTNSRIRCFQTCRRKHYYEFELGIERVDEEEAESLYFGNAWHAALEAWFLALKGEQIDSSSDVSPVSAIGIDRNSETPVYF